MIVNYTGLLTFNPDLFPAVMPQPAGLEGLELSAARILEMMEQRGFNATYMEGINKALCEMDAEGFEQIYSYIFTRIRNKFLSNDLTVFDNGSDLIDIVNAIISQNPSLKKLFVNLKTPDMANWIPGPGGINLEKGIGSCTGDLLENQSILGPFFKVGFLPCQLQLACDPRMNTTHDKLNAELVQCKSQGAFDKTAQNIQQKQRKITNSLLALVKNLLKDKSIMENIMRWLAACVSSNLSRAKLGHSLAQNAMQG
jgi:hypothetical protein